MIIPQLDPNPRDREYKKRNFEQISKVVYAWLFNNDIGHREMDRDILGLDPLTSKGWQSMGVLHHLGLKKGFKGIFESIELDQAIAKLRADKQNFSFIIELLEATSSDHDSKLLQSLYDYGKSHDINFEAHFKTRLEEIENTDGHTTQTQSRREQGILRGILFKGMSQAKCALCHRKFPINLMVAAHIKERSKCSTRERKNPNIVMPLCKVGCDDFFEKGYVVVNQMGMIQSNENVGFSSDLARIINKLINKKCIYFNQDTKEFFLHRINSFKQFG
ncbi:MAG: hypothetical protein P8N92_01620 [Burkholderiales bacterium]|nr:hypothetical protein [Burkholderiales bacterium]